MKRLHMLAFCALLLDGNLCAQSGLFTVNMPFLGADAYASATPGPFSFVVNQAALARIRSPEAGVFCERRFMLAEDQLFGAAVAIPMGIGNIGIQLRHFGGSVFREEFAGVAYGRSLGKNAAIGVQFNQQITNTIGYGKRTFFSAEIGMIFQLSEQVRTGIHVSEMSARSFKKNEQDAASGSYVFAFGYEPSKQVLLCMEIVKKAMAAVNVLACFQYQFADRFFARLGIASGTKMINAGAGVRWKNMRVDVTGSSHPQLGFSPGLAIVFYGKNAEK